MKTTQPTLLHKARLVLDTIEHYGITSFADIGGSWGVHGGYSYTAMLPFKMKQAFLIDAFVPEVVRERFEIYPNFKIIKGAFGDPAVLDQLPELDAVFMFDILLHQVDPDWDRILELYAQKTKHFVIYNQQWVMSERSVRLIDLGEEGYFKHSAFGALGTDKARQTVSDIFANMDAPHATIRNKRRCDGPDIWQWGITTPDLVRKMWDLGYKLDWMKNFGPFPGIQGIENNGFCFVVR